MTLTQLPSEHVTYNLYFVIPCGQCESCGRMHRLLMHAHCMLASSTLLYNWLRSGCVYTSGLALISRIVHRMVQQMVSTFHFASHNWLGSTDGSLVP